MFIMGKYVIVVLIVIAFVIFQTSNTVDAQKLEDVVAECKIAENATDNDYMNLKINFKPKTRTMKCLCACIGEKMGSIINNKLNPERLLAHAKTLPINNDDKVQQSVKGVIEECENIQDPDRCELGGKLLECIRNGSDKRGIKILSSQ